MIFVLLRAKKEREGVIFPFMKFMHKENKSSTY